MAQKDFKTLDEQIDILKSRGLNIPDEVAAKAFLYKNNYYRISGYSLTLRKNNVFFKNVSFQNIIDIYNFDHELRHILLKYLEIIEVRIKSVYAYEFSRRYGSTGYLEQKNFSNSNKYNDIISKTEKQKEKRLSSEAYLKHFVNERKEAVPLWAYVDLMTISDISLLYSITDKEVQTDVANAVGILRQGAVNLGKFMHSMTIIRNLCAHGSRLYNRLFEQKPSLNKDERSKLRKNPDGLADNSHLFGFILIMKRLLEEKDFILLKKEVIALSEQIPFVDMKYYGFPDDWKNTI